MLKEIRRALEENGWVFARRGKGSHEIWRHPNGSQMPIPTSNAPDTGRRRLNILVQIRGRALAAPITPITQEEGKEEVMALLESLKNAGENKQAVKYMARRILEDGGAGLLALRQAMKRSVEQVAHAVGPGWFPRRLKEVETVTALPLQMTSDEFLGWGIGIGMPDDSIQELLGLLMSQSEVVFIEKPQYIPDNRFTERDNNIKIVSDITGDERIEINGNTDPAPEEKAPFIGAGKGVTHALQAAVAAANEMPANPKQLGLEKKPSLHRAPSARELISLRNAMGISQEAMAHKIGMARSSYAALETGRRSYPISELRAWIDLKESFQPQPQPEPKENEMAAILPTPTTSAKTRQDSIDKIVKILNSQRITDGEVIQLEEKLKANFLDIVMGDL